MELFGVFGAGNLFRENWFGIFGTGNQPESLQVGGFMAYNTSVCTSTAPTYSRYKAAVFSKVLPNNPLSAKS
jgi:hypothetical protein